MSETGDSRLIPIVVEGAWGRQRIDGLELQPDDELDVERGLQISANRA